AEWADFSPAQGKDTDLFPQVAQGDDHHRAGFRDFNHVGKLMVLNVMDVKSAVLANPRPHRGFPLLDSGYHAHRPNMGPDDACFALHEPQGHIVDRADPRRALDNRVEYGLYVGG